MATTALVLGAGGITGVAWQLGMLIGLRAEGADLTRADLVVGTSAGAVTGALVAAGIDPAQAAVVDAPIGPDDPPMRPDWVSGQTAWALLQEASADRSPIAGLFGSAELRRKVGQIAVGAKVGSQEELLASFGRRLPVHEWPARLLVTAVDVETGEPVAWTAAAGVPLVPAVAASCAVPCLFPPIAVNGSRYMDGGVRSRTNADLAAGHDRVVILAPRMPLALRDSFDWERSQLAGTTTLLEPDEGSAAAIGGNVFAGDRWAEVIAAATAQGRRAAATVTA